MNSLEKSTHNPPHFMLDKNFPFIKTSFTRSCEGSCMPIVTFVQHLHRPLQACVGIRHFALNNHLPTDLILFVRTARHSLPDEHAHVFLVNKQAFLPGCGASFKLKEALYKSITSTKFPRLIIYNFLKKENMEEDSLEVLAFLSKICSEFRLIKLVKNLPVSTSVTKALVYPERVELV